MRSRTSLQINDNAQLQQPQVRAPANAGPIGLMAFGMTTLMLNFYNVGVSEGGTLGLIACYGVMHGGFVQLLAGMWEISCGKLFTGTAFSSFGSFWLGIGLFDLLVLTETLIVGDIRAGKCIWLCIWGAFTFMMFLGTLRANRAVQFVFLSLTALFFLLAGGEYNETVLRIGAVVGIICGLSAMYTGWAELMNEVYEREVVPVFKIKRA